MTDQITLIVWEATVDVNVDDSEITKWGERDDRERSTLISQTRESQIAAQENDRKVEDLRRRSQNISGDAQREQIQAEFNATDSEFLQNHKVEEATRAAYKGDLEEMARFYNEAVELNPDNAAAYYVRDRGYSQLNMSRKNEAAKFRALAINDLNKVIEFKTDYSDAYGYRGFVLRMGKDYPSAIKDFDRAIEIDPTNARNYILRSFYQRRNAKDSEHALAYLNKAIELQPSAYACINRATFYKWTLKNYGQAINDLNKAIEPEPNNPEPYRSCW